MIIDKYVKIQIKSQNINHIKNNGFDVKCGDEIEYPVNKLSKHMKNI